MTFRWVPNANVCAYCNKKIGLLSRRYNQEIIDDVDLLFTYSSRKWVYFVITDTPYGKKTKNPYYALRLYMCPRCSELGVQTKKDMFLKSRNLDDFFELDFCKKCLSTNVRYAPDNSYSPETLRALDVFGINNLWCQDCGNQWSRPEPA
jgi:hypothetical protein